MRQRISIHTHTHTISLATVKQKQTKENNSKYLQENIGKLQTPESIGACASFFMWNKYF